VELSAHLTMDQNPQSEYPEIVSPRIGGHMMKTNRRLTYFATLGMILLAAGVLFAQATGGRALLVNGVSVDAPVLQVEGHSYVDIQALAEALNGSITFEPDRIILGLPGPNAPTSSGSSAAPEKQTAPLSREFARSAIAVLAGMREWRGVVTTVIRYGLPVVGTWPQDYHDRVEADLMQAQLAATSKSDQSAAQLLENEFSNTDTWATDVVAARQALNASRSVDPNALQNDALLTQISNCGQFLSNMIVSGVYTDDSSCH
jgi:hypothetical protein